MVMTKGSRCLGWPGCWISESMLTLTFARAVAMPATIPGRSSTTKRR